MTMHTENLLAVTIFLLIQMAVVAFIFTKGMIVYDRLLSEYRDVVGIAFSTLLFGNGAMLIIHQVIAIFSIWFNNSFRESDVFLAQGYFIVLLLLYIALNVYGSTLFKNIRVNIKNYINYNARSKNYKLALVIVITVIVNTVLVLATYWLAEVVKGAIIH